MEQRKNTGSNFLVQGSILAIASIISRLIGLIYRIPLNHIIGNEGVGIYGYAYKVYNICLILSCYSIPTAVSRLVSAKLQRREHKNAYQILVCALVFGMLSGGLMTGILYYGADFFALRLSNPSVAMPLRILAPNVFIFSIMGVLRGYFQGKNTMLPTSISQIIEQIVNAIVSIVAAYQFMLAHSASLNIAAYGATGGTLGTVIGSLTGLLFLLFVFTIYRPTIKRQIRRDRTTEFDTYKDSFKLIIMTIVPIILSQTVYQISGLLDASLFHLILAGKEVTEEARNALIGIYTNQYEILTNVPIAIATAIGVAIVPSLTASIARKNNSEAKHKIHAAIKFNMIVAIPSAIGLAVLAKPIIMLLFSSNKVEELATSSALLYIGSISVVFIALSTTSNAILQSLDKLRIPVYHSAIALVIHAIIVGLLLKFTSIGIYALVIGYALFAFIVCILNWRYIKKTLNYRQELIKSFIMPFMASVIMGVIAFLSHWLIHKLSHSNFIALIVSILLAMIVYVVILVFMRAIDENELANLPKGYKLINLFKKLHLL